MRIIPSCSLGLALFLAALAGPTAKAGHPVLSLNQMLKQADLGFHGQVIAIEEEAVPEKGMAFTHVTFRIVDVLFNQSQEPVSGVIKLTFAGGTVDGKIVKVSDVPEFKLNQEVVALVRHDGKRYASPIIGGIQGLFRVMRDEQSSEAYPVDATQHGIEKLAKGEIVPTAKVASVRAGEVVYSTEQPNLEMPKVSAPLPATPSASAREFSVSEPRPAHLLRLPEFLGAITEQYQKIASLRR